MTTSTSIPEIVGIIVGILFISGIVLAVCKKFKLPFTITLVLVGIVIQEVSNIAPEYISRYFDFGISPNIILYVCLPTLIFESAFNIDARQLQRNIVQILTLAIPGLLISTFIIGAIVSFLTPLNFITSLLLGAILSATDPVAVISIFKQLGVPKRLTVLVEGESLFNDATAFVTAKIIFGIMLAGILTGHQLMTGVEEFLYEFFGGITVGAVIAMVIGYILGKVDSDPTIEISLTTILAYSTFIIGQNYFHVSGAMATLTAGIIMSHWRFTKISPSVVHYLDSFWEYLAYVSNAFIFLVIGLSIFWQGIANAFLPLCAVIVAMLISRAFVIFLIIPILGKLPKIQPIDLPFQSIMYWGGMRGAIALAVILSLGKFENSELLTILVTGAVLFTLLAKGLTINKLVKLLGLDKPPLSDRLARAEAKSNAKQNTIDLIPELQEGGLFSASIAKDLSNQCHTELKELNNKLQALREQELTQDEETRILLLKCLAKEKSLFYEMYVKGHISERAQRFLSENIETRTDILRYDGKIEEITMPSTNKRKWRKRFSLYLDQNKFTRNLAQILQQGEVGRQYALHWSYYQGADSVLKYLKEIKTAGTSNVEAITTVEEIFTFWKSESRLHLDSVAEQFPEFVNIFQSRLAKRLVLSTELSAFKQQAIAGLIPAGAAEVLEDEMNNNIRNLRETRAMKIDLDPKELLRKVDFFKNLSSDDFDKISNLLHSRVVSEGHDIIHQGETGTSLFIIMRGVIRVSREDDGVSRDLATLLAGDFFGEMALLLDEKRSATCRAVSPCALFELRKHDLKKVKATCPGIQHALEVALKERKEAN